MLARLFVGFQYLLPRHWLTNLVWLHVGDNLLTSLDPLAGLSLLEQLYAGQNSMPGRCLRGALTSWRS